jgi:hypothetical protein
MPRTARRGPDAVVPNEQAERALTSRRAHPLGRDAAVIGRIDAEHRRS